MSYSSKLVKAVMLEVIVAAPVSSPGRTIRAPTWNSANVAQPWRARAESRRRRLRARTTT